MIHQKGSARTQPIFMHPAIFVSSAVLLGELFALQDWMGMRLWSYHVGIRILLEAWGMQYFIWGVVCWLLWWQWGRHVQKANLFRLITLVLPLSIVLSVLEEMIWVLCFPDLPLNRPHMSYWPRLVLFLNEELVDNLVIFWCAFFLFRGLDYYQQLREKDASAAELKTQLANAQLRALRMQLNPHFLFNTMNSISSLMQTDISSADIMLEQLSSLLRITLERGEVQLIPLSDEMEFIEMYLAMQDCRFTGRIRQEISIEPELHDALVPAMLLQPLIENAYSHGLSKLEKGGQIAVGVFRRDSTMVIQVTNSGQGLARSAADGNDRPGVGLANVKDRLSLHYGCDQTFAIEEKQHGTVQVTLTLPLQFSERQTRTFAEYGV
jgi:two-component system, LytTR family, sensor kinase